jgi:hypothetical protein
MSVNFVPQKSDFQLASPHAHKSMADIYFPSSEDRVIAPAGVLSCSCWNIRVLPLVFKLLKCRLFFVEVAAYAAGE